MGKQYTNDVNATAAQWLHSVQLTKKYSTYVKYQNTYRKYIQPLIGVRSMERISTSDCVGVLEDTYRLYREKAISQSTYNSVKIVLFQILNYAKSPVSIQEIKSGLPSAKGTHRQISVLTNEEQAKLQDFLLREIDAYKIGVLVCLYTGLRLGEICALKTDDIDLTRKCIHVKQTVQRIRSEDHGGKTILMVSDPKTASSIREIPLCDFLVKLLSRYPARTEYLLGQKPLEPRTYQYKLNQYLAALSIKGLHFHSLRHTFATNCIESGMDPKCLSEILGHADVNTTLNRYVHPSFNTKINQINVFAKEYERSNPFAD
ncbi:MAG: site-specific integrase [Muribaculum sp.]|nr:site-specific integrase [Muribaculum sp.]